VSHAKKSADEKIEPNEENNAIRLVQHSEIMRQNNHREVEHQAQYQQIPLQVIDSNGMQYMIAPEGLVNLESLGGKIIFKF
jgi:hypothetical protein